MKKVLILSPHTDDGEIGCGGTIAKFISKGYEVIYIAFSAAEKSLPKNLPKNTLRKEVLDATSCLGIKKKNCIVYKFEVRRFYEFRQEILDLMIKLNKKFKPDAVFLPSTNDTHQDHEVIAREGFRAFKKITLLGYEMPWNIKNFNTSCFIEISNKDLKTKIKAISKYKSQKNRNYSSKRYIESLAITRGVQIGKKYAESFEVVRWLMN